MKRMKRIATLLLAVSLCLSLAGCRELEKMRADQAFWNEDGTIQWQDATYKRLPSSGASYVYFAPPLDDGVYVTKPDVPVLLSRNYCDGMWCSKDGVYLTWDRNMEERDYYCRADKYDGMVTRLDMGFIPDTYAYEYWAYNEETGSSDYAYYKLSKQQRDAVDRTINTVEPTVLPDDGSLEFEYSVYLEECSDDLLFRDDAATEIRVTGNTYYVTEYYVEDRLVYKVPDADAAIFKTIMAAQIKSEPYLEEDIEYFF